MLLTSETVMVNLSKFSAEIGSYSSRRGHSALIIMPSVQERFCQMASVTNGAKGWSMMRIISRVLFKRGVFLYNF